MRRILVVEDELHLAAGLQFNLEAEGYEVDLVETGEAALQLLERAPCPFSLIVLDVMLPGIDGFSVVTQLRQAGQFVPVLMLTARGQAEDVLLGFSAGADDYLPKPFELPILIARIGGLLRRHAWLQRQAPVAVPANEFTPAPEEPAEEFRFGDKVIDFGRLELHAGERVWRLTLMEANLLRYLLRHEGKAVSRKAILEEVWNVREDTDTRAIDNFVVRLRRYIEDDPAQPKHLVTVRGVGYRFVASPKE